MWTSSLLKKNAWDSLKSYYWVALGVTIVAGILGANGGFSFSFSGGNSATESMEDMEAGELITFLIVMLVVSVVAWAIGCAYVAFLGSPVRVGQCKFFCSARNGDVNFSHLFSSFSGGSYMSIVKTMFFMQLYIALWSLLFWIPGIIKTYEYFLIPYLLSENPNLPKERAFEISKKTMEGEKMNLFWMQFSFIGWYLLGLAACCIGVYGVIPYTQATMAEFYMCMRAKMISYGFTTEEELSGNFGGFDGFGGGFGGGFNNNSGNPYDADNSFGGYTGNSFNNTTPSFNQNPDNTSSGKVSLTKPSESGTPGTEMPDITQDAFGNPYDNNNPYNQ